MNTSLFSVVRFSVFIQWTRLEFGFGSEADTSNIHLLEFLRKF